ncbi:GlcG/HbpS family heme-binding protein [Aestuariivirga sp. YIM B02566]|uniref:Heme-binding protein n=1 Tax=Taklimakanibacter albus TaxID=2800327 RepID=A0ACC5R9W6_9HYPH|nr:heme-binding protein [Aestuariivirga sp. YIM B02566]MBK1869372.1 heme-binding protein [Aestuariivirga sp. YIM B02566]
MLTRPILAFALLTLMPLKASAAELPTAPYLPLDMALKAATAALEKCQADGQKVSVAVVERSGATKILLKADGSGPHTVASATGKAFTSASMGRDTSGLSDFIKANGDVEGLRDMDSRMVILAGGLPIRIGDALVGGIGVGGAPSGKIDEVCAKAGVEAIGGALK